jgi:hypothetical protein
MQHAVSESAFRWRRNRNDIDRHANQRALERIVGMPGREPGDRTKGRHHRAQKQQRGVNRQVCGTEPIVLPGVRELVSEQPSTMPLEPCRLHDDGMSYGDRPRALETSGGQSVKPRARRLTADALRPSAAQQQGRGVPDQSGRGGPHAAKHAERAPLSSSRDRNAGHEPRLSRAVGRGLPGAETASPAGRFQKSGLSACGTAEVFPGYHSALSAQTSSTGSTTARRSVTVADHGVVKAPASSTVTWICSPSPL